MSFIEKYVHSLGSSDLRDDEHHHATDALCAAALADASGRALGSLLARVKYADGSVHKAFEAGTGNLVALLRVWEARVKQQGLARKWVKLNTEWDANAAHALFKRVAHSSLAYWMDPNCSSCHGAKQTPDRRICPTCNGTGCAPIPGGGFERERVADMVSELQDLLMSHQRAAAALNRREG
jgi:hypothetical protein